MFSESHMRCFKNMAWHYVSFNSEDVLRNNDNKL